ncbi:MAG: FliM/FliN family flagellar motor C-terminal domain-containing protein [Rhodobacter sp.]|nr:FliM/FliN family flagellar motor C-terminal domain-containing protein [Rhodobacter sp.]
MGNEAAVSVLRRKAGGRPRAHEIPAMTPEKALRTAAARAGDEAFSIPVAVRDLTLTTDNPETLTADLPEPGLIVLIEDGDGHRGLAVAGPQVVAAAVEALTLGQVQPGEAALRRPTGTDAAMMAEFLNATLTMFAALAAGCPDLPPLDGFRFARQLPDARAGGMALADIPHLSCAAEFDFGLGAKSDKVIFVFPVTRCGAAGTVRSGGDWAATLQRSVLGTEACLDAVLCRFERPLAEIGGIAVGDVLPLGTAGLDGLTLQGPNGQRVTTGKLGRSGAMRAVRVRIAPDCGMAPEQPAPARPALGSEPGPMPRTDGQSEDRDGQESP